jgi:hypothetical protein
MAQRIPIQLHVANALQWLGTLYRSPADAIKEHVSNAIDEHVKAREAGTALDRCDVRFTLDKKHVVVEYPYGMSRKEFESALQRVADSAKRAGPSRTIGRLGIGIFSFQQIGRRCTFYSRKSAAAETIRVVLKEGADEASVETALAREALARPGLRVVISELKSDPTRSRGPLAPDALRRYLAERFEAYLREGWLTIRIRAGIADFVVTPAKTRLPPLLAELRELPLPQDAGKRIRLELFYDPSGRGRVAIRHRGVVVVEDLAALAAYGLEETAWAGGFVRGRLDADFLAPTPARSGFEENGDWIAFLDTLDRYLPTLQAELDAYLTADRAREAEAIADRALKLARDILDLDEFRDLALPGGLARRGRPQPASEPDETTTRRTRRRTPRDDTPPTEPGADPSPRGRRIRYEEVPFEDGSRAHSRFAGGVVQVNTLHPDYQQAAGAAESRLAYAALMIGKESIGWNDRTGLAGDFLEKLLDFHFKLQTRRSKRGRARMRPDDAQPSLDLGGDSGDGARNHPRARR